MRRREASPEDEMLRRFPLTSASEKIVVSKKNEKQKRSNLDVCCSIGTGSDMAVHLATNSISNDCFSSHPIPGKFPQGSLARNSSGCDLSPFVKKVDASDEEVGTTSVAHDTIRRLIILYYRHRLIPRISQ